MAASKPHEGAKGGVAAATGCLALFGLPFAAIGVFMGRRLVSMQWLVWAAQRWGETPATLTRLELEKHHDEDGTIYEVVAEYDYKSNGQPHHADRVGLSTGTDNFGLYQRHRYQRLKTARSNERAVTCYYVDPTRPLLDRTVRPGPLPPLFC